MGYVEDSPYGGRIDKGDAQRKPVCARPKTRPGYNTAIRKKKRHGHKTGGKAQGMRPGGMNRIKGS